MRNLLCDEESDEPIAPIIDTLAGSSLQQRQYDRLLKIDATEEIVEIETESVPKPSLTKQKLQHMRQGKSKILQVEISPEETMQLHEKGLELKQRKLEQQRKIQEEKDRRESERKKYLAHKRAIQERNKELSKKRYTYDFNGNLLFMKRFNPDAMPKNTINLPYTWHLSQQEVEAIEEKRRKKKEEERYRRLGDKPKLTKTYSLPDKFSKPMIKPKFDYDRNINFEKLKPK